MTFRRQQNLSLLPISNTDDNEGRLFLLPIPPHRLSISYPRFSQFALFALALFVFALEQ